MFVCITELCVKILFVLFCQYVEYVHYYARGVLATSIYNSKTWTFWYDAAKHKKETTGDNVASACCPS